MVHPKFSYYGSIVRDLKKKQTLVAHTGFYGNSSTGKNWSAYVFIEEGMERKLIKPWFLWCADWQHLQENLTLIFPSNLPKEKYKLSKFKPLPKPPQYSVRIYVPVSEHAPTGLFNDFIVPFTISIDKLGEPAFQILCGSIDCSAQYSEYKSLIQDNMSLPRLKKEFVKANKSKYYRERGFVNDEWSVTHKAPYAVQQMLMRRLVAFDKEGIFAHSGFEFALEKLLKKEIFNRDTIVILYLGGIKNEAIRRFVFICFIETMRALLEQNKGEKLPFKNILYFNEMETLAVATRDKDATTHDMVINRYLKERASNMRHINCELWGDIKSQNEVDSGTQSKFTNRYITYLDDPSEIKKFGEDSLFWNTGEFKLYLKNVKQENTKRPTFRFVSYNAKISEWKKNKQKQYGYEHKRPRLTMDGKVEMDYHKFNTLNKIPTEQIVGSKSDETMASIKQRLAASWKSDEDSLWKYLQEIDKDKKKDTKEDSFYVFMNECKKIKQKEPEIKKADLVREMIKQGWKRPTAYLYLKQAETMGMEV